MIKLHEELARLKGEAFNTPQGKAVRQQVMDFFKPWFDLSLDLTTYGLNPIWFQKLQEDKLSSDTK